MLALDATENTSATTHNARLVAKTSVKTAAHGGTTTVDLNAGQAMGCPPVPLLWDLSW